jgi:hypothetical protein
MVHEMIERRTQVMRDVAAHHADTQTELGMKPETIDAVPSCVVLKDDSVTLSRSPDERLQLIEVLISAADLDSDPPKSVTHRWQR